MRPYPPSTSTPHASQALPHAFPSCLLFFQRHLGVCPPSTSSQRGLLSQLQLLASVGGRPGVSLKQGLSFLGTPAPTCSSEYTLDYTDSKPCCVPLSPSLGPGTVYLYCIPPNTHTH